MRRYLWGMVRLFIPLAWAWMAGSLHEAGHPVWSVVAFFCAYCFAVARADI